MRDGAHQNQHHSRIVNRRPHILLGITGSVAAVKGPKLALRLANEIKANVKVVLTRTVEHYFWKEGRAVASYDGESWRELVAATSSSLDLDGDGEDGGDWRLSNGSISIHYAEEEWTNYKSLSDSVLHIDLRNWADMCLIAPLSAHTLAKIANGLCDDLLTCCIRAWDFGQRKSLNGNNDGIMGKPVILAPAMNTAMWDHPLTRMQLEAIQKFSGVKEGIVGDEEGRKEEQEVVFIVEPATKKLACGDIGAGALAELDDIICAVKTCLVQFETNGCTENGINDTKQTSDKDSSTSRKESMKNALLHYAKQRFSEMKSTHEEQSTGLNSSASQLAAPISPTPNLIIEAFLPRLNLDSDSLLVDLGCGDGRWLIAAHGRTKCQCLGIDVDEERLKIAQESIGKNELEQVVQVRKQDVFEFVKTSDDFYKADVIVLYLFREAMMEMGTLISQRLLLRDQDGIPRKRVQLLSVGFGLSGWSSIHEEKINGIRVYLYSTE